jgi:hypothetical protein
LSSHHSAEAANAGRLIAAAGRQVRIYVGAHLPLDVAGGMALGLAIEAAMTLVSSRIAQPPPGEAASNFESAKSCRPITSKATASINPARHPKVTFSGALAATASHIPRVQVIRPVPTPHR